MITRRVLLGTGAAVVGAGGLLTVGHLTHRLDDVADAVGLDPKPLPDPADTRIVRRAARACATLLTTVEAAAAANPGVDLAPVAAIVREQLAAVGGSPATTASLAPVTLDALEQALSNAAADRAADAVDAGSAALVRVLASMSAGQAQCARAVRRLA
ncbi:hypothetical protein [Aeromicrobium wangtongii]|uniref:Tat (Twin-arginine translocation) pathway signal sequence n=1 Tax=Aeromicrobium wangtongii TaxID=2969247 RepID=A0ABY5M5X9_9ACTN|nr:hypothetical protein [Aeromicrobium wangtongii]MCD9198442.1 hypothetical protein [Aeromicrobium wangtongii]UUP12471.1 hypothetical protein NQV15_11460 [Aeromicrobium wangtongii]